MFRQILTISKDVLSVIAALAILVSGIIDGDWVYINISSFIVLTFLLYVLLARKEKSIIVQPEGTKPVASPHLFKKTHRRIAQIAIIALGAFLVSLYWYTNHCFGNDKLVIHFSKINNDVTGLRYNLATEVDEMIAGDNLVTTQLGQMEIPSQNHEKLNVLIEKNCIQEGIVVSGNMFRDDDVSVFNCYINLHNILDSHYSISNSNGTVIIRPPNEFKVSLLEQSTCISNLIYGIYATKMGRHDDALEKFQCCCKSGVYNGKTMESILTNLMSINHFEMGDTSWIDSLKSLDTSLYSTVDFSNYDFKSEQNTSHEPEPLKNHREDLESNTYETREVTPKTQKPRCSSCTIEVDIGKPYTLFYGGPDVKPNAKTSTWEWIRYNDFDKPAGNIHFDIYSENIGTPITSKEIDADSILWMFHPHPSVNEKIVFAKINNQWRWFSESSLSSSNGTESIAKAMRFVANRTPGFPDL